MAPIMVVVKLASSNIPNALKMGTIYGRIANIAVNCINANAVTTNTNGLSDRFRSISLNLLRSVGDTCVHFVLDFMHSPHVDDIRLICCNCLNSAEILSVDTQPRRICIDFCASSTRFFDNSHIGASGMNSASTIDRIGMVADAMATCRHDKNVPSIQIRNMPLVVEIPAIPISTPRTDGSLFKKLCNESTESGF